MFIHLKRHNYDIQSKQLAIDSCWELNDQLLRFAYVNEHVYSHKAAQKEPCHAVMHSVREFCNTTTSNTVVGSKNAQSRPPPLSGVTGGAGRVAARLTPSRKWHPNESHFGEWIYKNTGQTITGASGEGCPRTMTKKVISFELKKVTPLVTVPGDTNLSDATATSDTPAPNIFTKTLTCITTTVFR